MASSTRGFLRLTTSIRSTAIRPRTFSSVPKWRHLSAVSLPAWCTKQTAHNSFQPTHVAMNRPAVPVRWYASEGITVVELEKRVIDVLKAFDKIVPEKKKATNRYTRVGTSNRNKTAVEKFNTDVCRPVAGGSLSCAHTCKVTVDAHFINDLGLDSLDVVEIVMAFEDEFAVEIDDEQAEKLFTAKDAIEFLKKEMDAH